MTSGFEKFAVYWIPQSGTPLAIFGAHWTGWCADAGEPRQALLREDFPTELQQYTVDVRRHGMHGQLRSAFNLAPGRSSWALESALERIAEQTPSVVIPRLHLALVDGRISLAPADGDSELDRLAIRLNRLLASLAATTSETDAQGQSPASIPQRPRALDTPVGAVPVLNGQCFHIPLSDKLPEDVASVFAAEIAPLILPLLDTPPLISDIALVGDPGYGRPLRLLRRLALRESVTRPVVAALPAIGPRLYNPLRHRTA